MAAALEATAVVSALATYRLEVLPRVRRQLRGWEARAAAIPDPALRETATTALRGKGSNAEATAVFAILAPRARRAGALRAMTALQVAVDYLDTLGERPSGDPLASGLALHRALEDSVSPGTETSDWYAGCPHGEDGGYLAALVAGCREEVAALPAWAAVQQAALRAAIRCGEGQSHTHASHGEGGDLREWAERQPSPVGYRWWEVAAGACSSVAVHALIAAAADPRTSAEDATSVEAAYFPPIGALTVLLDDLVDREEDAAAGQHSYLTYCASEEAAAERLALIARRARTAIAQLRHRSRHAAILAGVAGYYLGQPGAQGAYAAPARAALLETLGAPARLVMVTRRGRRRG